MAAGEPSAATRHTMSVDDTPTTVRAPEPSVELRATVVEYEDRPDECTIYPPDAPADRRTTAWLTAERGSFVDARRCR